MLEESKHAVCSSHTPIDAFLLDTWQEGIFIATPIVHLGFEARAGYPRLNPIY